MYWSNLVWACKMHLLGTVFLKKANTHTLHLPTEEENIYYALWREGLLSTRKPRLSRLKGSKLRMINLEAEQLEGNELVQSDCLRIHYFCVVFKHV